MTIPERIALSDREIVFEPFWLKSEATPGTGLGLVIAKKLIDKRHACIWVDETPGSDETFKILLEQVAANVDDWQ